MNRLLIVVVLICFFSGVAVAFQAIVNSDLAVASGDGLWASTVSFGTGAALLAFVVFSSKRLRRGLREAIRQSWRRNVPRISLFVGIGGAVSVASQSFAAAVTGLALFTSAAVVGTLVGGTIIDLVGAGGRPREVRPLAIAGAAIAVAVVIWSITQRALPASALWLTPVPVLGGFAAAWQQDYNGALTRAARSPVVAAFINFSGAFIVLLIASLVRFLIVGQGPHFPPSAWLYSGGALGAASVVATAASVNITGVLLLSLASIAGQLITSVALTASGLRGGSIALDILVAGVVFVAAGISLVRLPLSNAWLRRSSPPERPRGDARKAN